MLDVKRQLHYHKFCFYMFNINKGNDLCSNKFSANFSYYYCHHLYRYHHHRPRRHRYPARTQLPHRWDNYLTTPLWSHYESLR